MPKSDMAIGKGFESSSTSGAVSANCGGTVVNCGRLHELTFARRVSFKFMLGVL
ncbi:MAG: hypothetical protein SFV23_16085 [Planctomycetaceae bacterium]|nr:hypothetical protein [Planctomycetaceae bacterium]